MSIIRLVTIYNISVLFASGYLRVLH